MSTEKNCYNCAYKGTVPGDSHISCRRNWELSNLTPPKASEHGISKGWYIFPVNFDPAWQEEECKGFSTDVDPKLVTNPMEDVFSMISRYFK